MELKLSDEEATLLRRLLDRAFAEAKVEVRHTELREYREKVKHEEALLRALIERMGDTPTE